ncbi:agmatinase family protein [Sphingobium sp.]|uniref:agmatinase family protein n=1 Tax=Sphingobium sp. TaxID=1912891 RepID=UPI0026068895|nr:agmatinase family protein [Sphingobium sp.]
MARTTLLARSAAFVLALATLSGPAVAQDADPLASLSPEKKAFLSDPATLERFGLTPEKVRVALTGRSAADVDAYAVGLMAVVADSKYQPGRDAGEIALNPQARGWNAGTTLRPKMFDKMKRDDGPFSLKRYMFQKGAVATFADAPVAIRKEDLIAGKVEVAFVGVPLDFSSGWRDAKHAPSALRNMDGLVGADADGGVDPGLVLSIADYGDLSPDYMAPDRGLDHIRTMIAEMASVGTVPFVVGGDHTIMYPDVAAMVDTYGAGKVALVQFDAHADAELGGDHLISDNQTLTRLLEQNLLRGSDVTLVGLHGRDAGPATQKRLTDAGAKIVPTAAVQEKGWQSVTNDLIAGLKKGPENVFVSFDMSVLDPGDAPASGRPVPGGLSVREAIPMVRQICAQTKVVGFDLLDAAPILDPTYASRMSANYILHACLSGIAMRKTGTPVKTAKR